MTQLHNTANEMGGFPSPTVAQDCILAADVLVREIEDDWEFRFGPIGCTMPSTVR